MHIVHYLTQDLKFITHKSSMKNKSSLKNTKNTNWFNFKCFFVSSDFLKTYSILSCDVCKGIWRNQNDINYSTCQRRFHQHIIIYCPVFFRSVHVFCHSLQYTCMRWPFLRALARVAHTFFHDVIFQLTSLSARTRSTLLAWHRFEFASRARVFGFSCGVLSSR